MGTNDIGSIDNLFRIFIRFAVGGQLRGQLRGQIRGQIIGSIDSILGDIFRTMASRYSF